MTLPTATDVEAFPDMSNIEHETGELICPRCGETAEWTTSGSDTLQVEVSCTECGRFSIDPEELEAALSADEQDEDPRERRT